ncbi:MAG: multiheme c-type cytochrome, partial [Planctomycetota bacterium]
FGPLADPADNPGHENGRSEIHAKSEFCSACHTLTHPHSGLVIENTYEEWKKSPYATAGIQCQDCHMRTVAQSIEVARTMKPVKVPGKTTEDGSPRANVYAHLFVGANANGKLVGSSERHTAEAVARLESAATLALKLPEKAAGAADIEVAVTNVGAGHAIPTSITEMRQVWIDLAVTDAGGKEVYRSGAIDAAGRVDPEAVMFHAVLVDKDGKVTYKPWTAVKMVKEKLIGPKETVRERYRVPLPAGSKGPFAVKAVLRYRSAPQEVMDELFGKGKYPIRTIDMASAEGTLR